MHPPVFHLDQRLSDWPECWLELRCPCLSRTVLHPVKMLLQRGDRPFRSVLAALHCSACKGKPAPVYLVAGHVRDYTGGPLASWALQLVPSP